MKKQYSIMLLLCGAGWFLVAGVLGYAVPILGSMWFQHLICGVLTAFVVGIAFRVPILRWSGWRWYLLPLLTLFAGTTVFGFLLACSWHLADSLRGAGRLEREAFYKIPLAFVFYSMCFLYVLYPLALL